MTARLAAAAAMSGKRAREILRDMRGRGLAPVEGALEGLMSAEEAEAVRQYRRDVMPWFASFYDALCDIARKKGEGNE